MRFQVWTNLKTPFQKISYFSYDIANPNFLFIQNTSESAKPEQNRTVKKDYFQQ